MMRVKRVKGVTVEPLKVKRVKGTVYDFKPLNLATIEVAGRWE